MARVLSGIQPSGEMHIGNYFGAVRQWVAAQDEHDSFYCVVDLHALTLEIDPAELRRNTLSFATGLLAAGLDPGRCTLFVQGHVPEHTGLSWLLECTATYGELRRMTQWKDKSHGQDSVRAGLLTYPVLMAADILLYDADFVPVGDDQRQHLELTRNLAQRFNHLYGETFVLPQATVPATGARVMDLQEPTKKMSKSTGSALGTVFVNDSPELIIQKVRKAVTDTERHISYDPKARPGVSNLLELLAACTGERPQDLARRFDGSGALKNELAGALVATLAPLQERYRDLSADPGAVAAALAKGAAKARSVASVTLERARDAMGLLPPGA
ncbi:MAG TPA: tryptophan--tRNA ligase [Acidimicrobiales bacterium]|nr:tryptophan--tRNA ligase [Acidimicrobiales bacterium]